MKVFVGDQSAVLKRFGESTWYDLIFDNTGKGHLEMAARDDSLRLKLIKVKIILSTEDNLQFIGKEGTDSIKWLFKRKY